ncbi:MAG: type II toxin-antitoxin system RelE/ParE family toxin, partial [Gammaproteobacteria bacterium]|nr:type II toxin-antitoxin system RelE/ParE family toxin [Gammaproteobacteria bacterium]
MIKSFRCKDTQTLFETGKTRRWASLVKVATRKLAQLDAAVTLDFLKSPPGN